MFNNNTDSPPLVSVWMITYNQEAFIEQAIEGILMQQVNFKHDIVIGDDCSTDGTRAILLKYNERYPGLFKLLLHDKNMGPRSNQIATMAACTGEYVAMCEGDDYWTDKNKLQTQVDFLRKNPEYSLSCHRIEHLIQDTQQLFAWQQDFFEKHPADKEIQLTDIFDPYLISTVSVVYRNSCIDMEIVKNLPHFKDIFLFTLLLNYGKGICHNNIMAVYRLHAGGIWSMQGKRKNLISNALTGIEIARFFKTKIRYLNLFACHESKLCLSEIVNYKKEYTPLIRTLCFNLLFTFSSYLSFTQKLKYAKYLIQTFV